MESQANYHSQSSTWPYDASTTLRHETATIAVRSLPDRVCDNRVCIHGYACTAVYDQGCKTPVL